MAFNARFLPLVRFDFPTQADRLAASWAVNDIGSFAFDTENGVLYVVKAAGSGASCFSPVTSTGGEQKRIGVSLASLRLVTSDNDVGAIAAIGGVGASDSDPVFAGDANGGFKWTWANGSHVGALGFELALPLDFDGSRDVTLEVDVLSGTSDPATFTVASSWDHGTAVSDTADDTATKSATLHTVLATIDKADVPDSAKSVTIRLTPGTHATNAIALQRVALKYFTK